MRTSVWNPSGVRSESSRPRDGTGRDGKGLSDASLSETASVPRPYLTAVRTSEAKELEAEVVRVHGPNWRAKLPPNPTAAEECRAWDEDGLRIHAASERLRLRAIEWHRGELGRLAA